MSKARSKKKRKYDYHELTAEELSQKNKETKDEIKKCINQMKEFEDQEKYLDAAKQQRKINVLKTRIEEIADAEIVVKQKLDNEMLTKVGEKNEKQFKVEWDEKTEVYIEKMKKSFEKLQIRQEKELVDLRKKLENKDNHRHTSSLLLSLRTKQTKLAKAKRYIEAENIRRNADIIEQEEKIQYTKKAQKANQRQLDVLYEKHQMALNALKQKFDSEKRSLNEKRIQQHQKLCNKVRKMTLDLQKKHTIEMIKSRKENLSTHSKNIPKIPKIKGISKLKESKILQSARTNLKEDFKYRKIQSSRR